ncbi:MAG: 3-deoxy-D-manno-octulosonic acid kinase [Gammaproteobacteria bacterium]|nr:MAG: 3-deoxy-D-manno-octulosonic acid kinase [Gammaproteobacteria bacterium]
MAERIERIGMSVIVYDHALVDQMDVSMFAAAHRADVCVARGPVAGRGAVAFIDVGGVKCVLRHYYRGGMIRRFVKDAFFWAGEPRTRSFAEWRLLAELCRRGLPVPQPVAARYVRRGPWYTADLVTRCIPGVGSLAARLTEAPQGEAVWQRVGAMIRRFHDARVCHADLNAHNIQIGANGDCHLLDFDRGRIMPGAGVWSERNLTRLHRSLEKVSRITDAQFVDANWQALMAGYGT